MTFSPLTDRFSPTTKFSSRQGNPITHFIIHHTAGGSNDGNEYVLTQHERKVSSTYLLRNDEELVGIVPEEHRPWTTGWEADKNGITVETVNTTGDPDWEISWWQLEKLCEISADLAYRYKWEKLDRSRIRGHYEFAATACPGPFIRYHFDYIINRANEILMNKNAILGKPVDFYPYNNPWRFKDTRKGPGPVGPLIGGNTYTINPQINARGLLANVVPVGPRQEGWLAFWAGGEFPGTSSVNFDRDVHAVANQIYIPMQNNTFKLLASKNVDVVIDIVGIYRTAT